ncbi:cytochrome-c oxidase, cbb3-type subunit III [Paracoccus tegillarcae]|uniref:Cytochrome-c oxidase, cbb3-type subunit III n=1 Tax=Paracoccus tegillarcae TaxID=1529068 RepID=A0A2K9F556_9RHOB|nr:cytochrome-c oxidase, cbb3-type subunit III [Paracoccus tegillarcae]AUH35532.1 cytochrome-c oxidase, cbb3-type subunit III [Paracoccus tegillarcae]
MGAALCEFRAVAAPAYQRGDLCLWRKRADLTTLAIEDPAHQFGVTGGAAVFRATSSPCHGAGAAGARGYPDLLDDDWLWGGSLEKIEVTVRHGTRNVTDADAPFSQMPAVGEFLPHDESASITEYVLSLFGRDRDAAMAKTGSQFFADNCVACHGDDGTGDRMQGAPDLTDAIWLYGGDREVIAETIDEARFGVMSGWSPRLSDAEVKAVTLYVYQPGGGE